MHEAASAGVLARDGMNFGRIVRVTHSCACVHPRPLRAKVDEFFKPTGPPYILFFYQVCAQTHICAERSIRSILLAPCWLRMLNCFFALQVPETTGPDGEPVLHGSTPKLALASSEVSPSPSPSPLLRRRIALPMMM